MKQKYTVVLALFVLTLALHSPSQAADDKYSFFGIKKFVQKGVPANPPKKKIAGIPANLSTKTPNNAGSDSELTEEEKKVVEEIVEKTPKNNEAVPTKENVKLPSNVLPVLPPKIYTAAPKLPLRPPRNPNSLIVRIPKPPAPLPQISNLPSVKKPPAVPSKQK